MAKQGRSITELAQELERQTKARKDYIAPQGAIDAKVVDGDVKIDGLNGAPVTVTDIAHSQFSAHLGIPKNYYDKMRAEQPQLLADNLNVWLHAKPQEQRLVRTLDGRARAFLSSKFRPLDNFPLAEAVLPALIRSNATVISSELTERRLYIKAILPNLSDSLDTGMEYGVGHADIREQRKVVAAITISNSEVGLGGLQFEPSVFTPWCTNLAILMEIAMKKYHIGKRVEAEEGSFEVFRDETIDADNRAFWLKVRDVAAAAFDEEKFRKAVDRLRQTVANKIASDNLPKVVELTVKELALPEISANSILSHLARNGDLTQWGLAGAITRTAQDFPDYDGATELERAGGKVLALPVTKWNELSEAA